MMRRRSKWELMNDREGGGGVGMRMKRGEFIHCLVTAYCTGLPPIRCLFTAYSLHIHCLFTAYSLPIHCVFTAYSLPIHPVFTTLTAYRTSVTVHSLVS